MCSLKLNVTTPNDSVCYKLYVSIKTNNKVSHALMYSNDLYLILNLGKTRPSHSTKSINCKIHVKNRYLYKPDMILIVAY
jgi:hypothetical protein